MIRHTVPVLAKIYTFLVSAKECSRTFLIYVFLRFAGISYGWFIAIHFGFNLSTYIQNCW